MANNEFLYNVEIKKVDGKEYFFFGFERFDTELEAVKASLVYHERAVTITKEWVEEIENENRKS